MNVLLRRLTDAYVRAGYVTTRALLGPQNLGSGTLTVTIQIGRIEGFTVNGQTIHRLATNERSAGGGWLTDAGYGFAFPASAGDPLRLADIDQGVAQINRMRRNQAQVQVLPGQEIGDSVIAIQNAPGDRTYYALGVDNYGAQSTGVTRYRAGFEADNLIGLQEVLSLNYIDSVESNAIVGSLARKVLAQVKAGEPFDALAKAYSVAATGAQGGEMPWMSFPVPAAEGKTQGLPLPIARTIAQLPAGGITPQPVQIGNAWVIVKLDAKRPTQIPPFEQVKDTVKAQLEVLALQKAAAAFTAAQIRGATIQQ